MCVVSRSEAIDKTAATYIYLGVRYSRPGLNITWADTYTLTYIYRECLRINKKGGSERDEKL